MTRNVLAVGLLCAACCAAGYVRGFGIAETRGRVLLAEQAEASASERETLAVAAAEAERLARQRLEAETERAAAIAGELSETRNRLAAERQAFTRRMDRVAEEASRHCAGLPAGWVRLYNEALGLAHARIPVQHRHTAVQLAVPDALKYVLADAGGHIVHGRAVRRCLFGDLLGRLLRPEIFLQRLLDLFHVAVVRAVEPPAQ